MFNIYVLRCIDNKYYIGKTKLDNDTIFRQHKNDKSRVFTNKYPPIDLIEFFQSDNLLEEDNTTKKYMIMYGIENVRGGSYTKLELEDWQIKSLEHEFKSASNCCFRCGEKGHFAKDCNEFDIVEYLKNFSTIKKIDKEINKLENIYDQLLSLNEIINDTNFITHKDIKDIKNLDKIKLELINLKIKQKTKDYIRTPMDIKKQIDINIRKNSNIINLTVKIENIFNKYFLEYKSMFKNDYIIQAYKIINLNLDKQTELNNVLTEYKSKDIIKKILLELYDKRISLIIL